MEASLVGRIHVIEPDARRRALVVRQVNDLGLHVEIYRDLISFCRASPSEGLVFVADGGEIACAIHVADSGLPFVMYAEQPSIENVVRAMRAGAWDYIQWPFEPRLLQSAVEQLASHSERSTQEKQLRAGAAAKVGRLTEREKEVLGNLLRGMSNKGIARTLGISPRTVEIHRGHMMHKLAAHSTADAVRIALYAGLDHELRSAA